MKKIITFLAILFLTANLFAQAPQKMSYQAVIRDGSSVLVTNHAVTVKVTILQGSTSVYTEIHSTSTNANGLVVLEIGSITPINLDWSAGPYYIKTETDPTGGTNYTIVTTNELLSVPYAMYSANGGTPGPQGPPGATGAQGPPGATGATGAQGPPGATGATGAQGPPGATGAQGPQGDPGPQGATGAQGPQGDPGPQGATGAQGPPGATGATGAQGPPGATGATGAQGPPGSANISGTSNYVIKFTGSTTGGNSQMFDNGTKIGVNTTSPVGKFHVYSTSGDAVEGESNSSASSGVYGKNSTSGTGVTGQSFSSGIGVQGISASSWGVYGISASSSTSGINGLNSTSSGTGVGGAGNNISGLVPTNGCGVSGTGTVLGVTGWSTSSSSGIVRAGGYFQTNGGASYAYVGCINASNVVRKIEGNGTVNTTVKDVSGKSVVLSAPEAPENFFMDFGSGQLVNGIAHVVLDPVFSKNIIVNSKNPLRVIIQLEGDCNGVFVTNKLQNGFDVNELHQGNSNVTFTWFVTANRADELLPDGTISKYSMERFAPAMSSQPAKQQK